MSQTPMSLEHLFHVGGAEEVMGILSISTCGFMAFWRCPFGVAGLIRGCGDILSWPENQTKDRAPQAPKQTAGLSVRVNLVPVCFHFDMAVLMPDMFIVSYRTCQNIWCKYLFVSLKYQPCARV